MEEASLVVVSPKRLHTARLHCCVTTRSLQGLETDARKNTSEGKRWGGTLRKGVWKGQVPILIDSDWKTVMNLKPTSDGCSRKLHNSASSLQIHQTASGFYFKVLPPPKMLDTVKHMAMIYKHCIDSHTGPLPQLHRLGLSEPKHLRNIKWDVHMHTQSEGLNSERTTAPWWWRSPMLFLDFF